MKNRLLLLVIALLCIFANDMEAQQRRRRTETQAATAPVPEVTKRTLTHSDYDAWKSIGARAITNDGSYAGYAINAQDGDGAVALRCLRDTREKTIERGSELRFTQDSEWAIMKIKAPTKATKDARRAKKKKEDLPKDSLGIYNLKTNELVNIPNIQSYKIPEKASTWVAYLLDAAKTAKDTTKKAPRSRKQPRKESDENGYMLVVRDLKTGVEQKFGFVTEYELSKNGKNIAFVSTGTDTVSKPRVYVWDIEKSSLLSVYEGLNKQKFKKLSFDETGNQLAFVADLDTNAKAQVRSPKLMYWKIGDYKASLLADEASNPAPKGWLVSGDFTPNFSKDGSKLFFGTNPRPAVQDTTLLADEIVSVEVWNHKDTRLQPQQKATLEQDKKRSYLAVVNLDSRVMTQLGTPQIPNIELAREGNTDFVLASTNVPYSNQHWDWNNKEDAYLINTHTGSKTLIKTKINGNTSLSPQGKYVYWFSNADTAWVAYQIATGKILMLTNKYISKFADEDDDHPDYPNPYGIAGWTKGDSAVLIYDKYDIWSVNTETMATNNLTQTGRTNKRTYRYLRLDPEERSIDSAKPLILRMFDNTKKGSGYSQLSVANKQVTDLYTCDCAVGQFVTKAKNTDDLLTSRSSFKEFPEVWHSNLTFKTPQKISNVGLQMDAFKWGSVETVNYKSTDGTPLQGLLYKPEGFDSTKKYPMLVYFYEKNSDGLYNFVNPSPSASASTNYAYAVSNGYTVFVPDIVYQIGYPGRSAYNCIMPGILSLLDKGFIDKNRIGVVGHSWGGYQAAYLITQTNLFKAAVPGAPVANMTSAYGGIRWGTGLSRQAQYERTQSRIGGTLWQKPMQYLENSPLFFLDKVQTPTLILHNDDDDAVPWYQGIELFMGLKRLEQPTWMLVYNGEKHGNRIRKNQKDFTVRMWQYLDHYLKDAPAPSWMKDGLPMIEKGINQHLETK
jgi:dipeptidyl aminopeptidase/acylaminoacyl peptidase